MNKQLEKVIWDAIRRYNAADLVALDKKGYFEELQAEVRVSVLTVRAKHPEVTSLSPEVFRDCMNEANHIRTNFIRAILPRYDYLKPYIRRNEADLYLLNSVETLYKLGGAEWCYFMFKPKEKWPGHFKTLLSQCFKGGKDNSLRNSPQRKIFLDKIRQGFTPRVSGSGSIYLELGREKIRFSDHDKEIELLYRDITESHVLTESYII